MRLLLGLVLAVGLSMACDCVQSKRSGPSATADELFPYESGEKTGFIDRNGKIVISPTLDSDEIGENDFDSGMLLLERRDEVAFLDRKGTLAIRRNDLITADDFQDGLAAALSKEGRMWGFLGADGEFAIKPTFPAENHRTKAGFFSEGLAAIEVDGLTGYIDKRGNWAIARQFAKGYEFREGFAAVILSGPCVYYPDEICCSIVGTAPWSARLKQQKGPTCEFALIDRNGRRITNRRFSYIGRVSEGLAPFLEKDKWGFINTIGEVVVEPRFEEAQPFSDGRALVRENNRYGFIDKSGSLVIPATYEWAGSFSSGLAPVGDVRGAGWAGYIDRNGRIALREEFEDAGEFGNGLALVQLLPKDHIPGDPEASVVSYEEFYRFAYIDRTGKHVFEFSP